MFPARVILDGVVGGLVTNGELWEGNGHAANLGSIMITDEEGNLTFVHFVASIMALQAMLSRVGMAVPTGSPFNWNWDALEPVLTQWLDSAGLALAKAITNTRAVIELEKVVIDGVMPRVIVARLLDRVHHHLGSLLGVVHAQFPDVF